MRLERADRERDFAWRYELINELPSMERLKQRAKALLRDAKAGDAEAVARMAQAPELKLAHAQWVVAKELGFSSWIKLREALAVAKMVELTDDQLEDALIKLALGHGYENARRSYAARLAEVRPDLAKRNLGLAALMGDAQAVRDHLAKGADPNGGTWPAICLAAAGLGISEECLKLLIDAGGDLHAGYEPAEWKGARLEPLYYAAGVANSAPRVKLLLEAGVDPNDNESMYHSQEHVNPEVVELLVKHGARWENTNALKRLLDYEETTRLETALRLGADPNELGVMSHAIIRGRGLALIKLLLDAGGDPSRNDENGRTAIWRAARLGRSDAIEEFAKRGYTQELPERERLLAKAASGDASEPIQPQNEVELTLLGELAATNHFAGVNTLLEMGWPANAKIGGLGSALNEAAFQGNPAVARVLLQHGATWDEVNSYGGDVWGSVAWSSRNLGLGDHVGVSRELVEAGSPIPNRIGGSEAVEAFLADWLEEHPDHPRVD